VEHEEELRKAQVWGTTEAQDVCEEVGMATCLICQSTCESTDLDSADVYRIQCPRCGEYEITDEADRNGRAAIDTFVAEHLYLLSAVARRSWDRNKRLRIDSRLLEDRSEFESRILSLCPLGTEDKMNFILRHIAEKSKCPGHAVRITLDEEYRRLYCKNGLELDFFLKSLDEQHVIRLDLQSGRADVTLTTNGWIRVEELDRPNAESKQAFVAMWFDKQLDSAYKDGILKLEEDTGFRMLRVDAKQFNDKICDHIVAEIRRSRFLIADVTRHRRAVYFEAGYAMGLGLQVIWTCRDDHMKRAERIFDTRQYNHIVWTTPQDLRERLRDRILATIG
jgi:hypothetical protein